MSGKNTVNLKHLALRGNDGFTRSLCETNDNVRRPNTVRFNHIVLRGNDNFYRSLGEAADNVRRLAISNNIEVKMDIQVVKTSKGMYVVYKNNAYGFERDKADNVFSMGFSMHNTIENERGVGLKAHVSFCTAEDEIPELIVYSETESGDIFMAKTNLDTYEIYDIDEIPKQFGTARMVFVIKVTDQAAIKGFEALTPEFYEKLYCEDARWNLTLSKYNAELEELMDARPYDEHVVKITDTPLMLKNKTYAKALVYDTGVTNVLTTPKYDETSKKVVVQEVLDEAGEPIKLSSYFGVDASYRFIVAYDQKEKWEKKFNERIAGMSAKEKKAEVKKKGIPVDELIETGMDDVYFDIPSFRTRPPEQLLFKAQKDKAHIVMCNQNNTGGVRVYVNGRYACYVRTEIGLGMHNDGNSYPAFLFIEYDDLKAGFPYGNMKTGFIKQHPNGNSAAWTEIMSIICADFYRKILKRKRELQQRKSKDAQTSHVAKATGLMSMEKESLVANTKTREDYVLKDLDGNIRCITEYKNTMKADNISKTLQYHSVECAKLLSEHPDMRYHGSSRYAEGAEIPFPNINFDNVMAISRDAIEYSRAHKAMSRATGFKIYVQLNENELAENDIETSDCVLSFEVDEFEEIQNRLPEGVLID